MPPLCKYFKIKKKKHMNAFNINLIVKREGKEEKK
jgi:hypothetical protein